MPAKVYLIGAGPGDPELITVKGARCLRQADVIIYDYLANEALLTYARDDAERIFVGKKGFSEHVTQDEINACIIERALGGCSSPSESNRIVARLKGGDPFVFGRGGEEALALHDAGIRFEIISGVTSGIAAPAYAGIPVTHRNVSSSVAFITGNEDPTKPETAINWSGIAHGADTLCFYMGIRNLPQISMRLIDAGKPAETPVALIRWGTTSRQEVLVGNLENIAEKAAAHDFKAPAIILVGEVAALRDDLEWRGSPPLAGMTVAVTRSRTQASALTSRLMECGAEVVECPTIEIAPLDDTTAVDDAVSRIAAYDWVVLTSANGVDYFFTALEASGLDARSLAQASIAAIGSATAERLKTHGISADLVPDEYRAEAMVDAMVNSGVGEGSSVLIARAVEAREALPEGLRAAGARVDVVPVYKTVPSTSEQTKRATERILAGDVDAITFTSSSTVENTITLLDDVLRGRPDDSRSAGDVVSAMDCYSIGPITTSTLRFNGVDVCAEADPYTIASLVETMLKHAEDNVE